MRMRIGSGTWSGSRTGMKRGRRSGSWDWMRTK